MKITFIRPSMFGSKAKDAMYPVVFAIVKSLTPKEVEIEFFDERVEEVPENIDSDIIAMSVETFSAKRAYELAKKYKSSERKIIMGGFHPTLEPSECLEYADAIIKGAAEDTWKTVIKDIERGDLKPIYESSGNYDMSECRPDYSVFKGKKYVPLGIIQFTRGCRYSCDFCSIHAFYGDKIRSAPIEMVIEEIKGLKEKYIFFADDNIFSDKEAARKMFTALAGLNKKWVCQISMDVAEDKEMLKLMKKAGCLVVLIGFETLDTENLKQMGKGANIKSGGYEVVIKNVYEAGLMIYGTFVIGYDFDDEETAGKLCDFAIEHNFAVANFNPLMTMPGTPLTKRLKDEGRLVYDKWWTDERYKYGDAMLEPKKMSKNQLMESCKNARFKFNTTFNILKRLVKGKANRNNFESVEVFMLANFISKAEIQLKQGRKLGKTEN